jgi:hypothetical protein
MSVAKRLTPCLLGSLLIGMGCTPPRPIEGVWRPGFGEASDHIPGPMKNFGPFDAYTDALQAACPLILSKPNATVGHLKDLDLELATRVATEYCAWLYYTPEHKYEMSMLTDLSKPDVSTATRKSCVLPTRVNDPRYGRGELKYIFALHNHPFGSELSSLDLRFIEEKASIHEWEVETKNATIRLSIIAFFSKSRSRESPTCDGFYQYIPATRELLKWAQVKNRWAIIQHGLVTWLDEDTYRVDPL